MTMAHRGPHARRATPGTGHKGRNLRLQHPNATALLVPLILTPTLTPVVSISITGAAGHVPRISVGIGIGTGVRGVGQVHPERHVPPGRLGGAGQ